MKKKPRAQLFFSASVWKKVFILLKKENFKANEAFVYSRSSIIPRRFCNLMFFINNGKGWIKRSISRWVVGFKFGELTFNRVNATYKAKQLRKKRLKKLKKNHNNIDLNEIWTFTTHILITRFFIWRLYYSF